MTVQVLEGRLDSPALAWLMDGPRLWAHDPSAEPGPAPATMGAAPTSAALAMRLLPASVTLSAAASALCVLWQPPREGDRSSSLVPHAPVLSSHALLHDLVLSRPALLPPAPQRPTRHRGQGSGGPSLTISITARGLVQVKAGAQLQLRGYAGPAPSLQRYSTGLREQPAVPAAAADAAGASGLGSGAGPGAVQERVPRPCVLLARIVRSQIGLTHTQAPPSVFASIPLALPCDPSGVGAQCDGFTQSHPPQVLEAGLQAGLLQVQAVQGPLVTAGVGASVVALTQGTVGAGVAQVHRCMRTKSARNRGLH